MKNIKWKEKVYLPYVDIYRDDFLTKIYSGDFNKYSGRAEQLFTQGFCIFRPSNNLWMESISEVLDQKKSSTIIYNNGLSDYYNLLNSDAYNSSYNKSAANLSFNNEIHSLLSSLYGRDPIPFRTIISPKASVKPINCESYLLNINANQYISSVWIALEDVNEKSGALFYYPESHRIVDLIKDKLDNDYKNNINKKDFHVYTESLFLNEIKARGLNKKYFQCNAGDVIVLHQNLIYGESLALKQFSSRWSHFTNYFFANDDKDERRKTSNRLKKNNTMIIFQREEDLFSNYLSESEKVNYSSKVILESEEKLDTAYIDQINCKSRIEQGFFGRYSDIAYNMNSKGFSILPIKDPSWIELIDNIRELLEVHLNIKKSNGEDIPVIRIQDGWRKNKLKDLLKISCHKEILSALRILYGKYPFPFQTLNFATGSRQHFHSDAVHFNSYPHGFMCGVWVALEDIHTDSGPLEYYPSSHNLPYRTSRDLGFSLEDVNSKKHPQKLFEEQWRMDIAQNNFKKNIFLAKKGDVLIWHANLLHGGSPVKNKLLTRWSQVSHYFFRDCEYINPFFKTTDDIECEKAKKDPYDLLTFL